ncbi:acyltransferase [Vibrio cholerae]|uniref:acyltransferase family protein n=1 Tax=Vibrio cholerae TaxID=666 RepID=UPI003531693A
MSSVPHRKDIQGLRAIAVLAVMVFHLNPTWLPGGFVGVDVFLVISGFLITSILLHKKSSAGYSLTETLKYFYVSRFKRIVPAYFLMLIIVALVAAVLFLPSDFNTFRKGLEKAVWFSSNRYFSGFGDYFAPTSYEQPLLHTWSLAVEIQFYLLAPFIVLLLPVRLLKWLFAGLLIMLTAIAEYRLRLLGIEQVTYYSLYARLPEFFAGGIAALYARTVSWGGGVVLPGIAYLDCCSLLWPPLRSSC